MSYQSAFAISAAGMDVERLRVEVAALNLANAHTVAGLDGRLFQPMRVVAAAANAGGDSVGFSELVDLQVAGPTAWVEANGTPPRRVLDPGHPLADSKGFVSQPNVDPALEMMTLMSALRSYEANVAALNTTRALLLKSLDIGGAS